jgi:hypothetical protein
VLKVGCHRKYKNKAQRNVLHALCTYHSVTVRGMVGSDTVKRKKEKERKRKRKKKKEEDEEKDIW